MLASSFIPKRLRYKKPHRARPSRRLFKKISYLTIIKGVVALKALAFGFLTSQQLVAMFQSINKVIKKIGAVRFFCFPNGTLSAKPAGARMGKGKGKPASWVFKVKVGFILCEISTPFPALAVKALNAASFKLPVPTKIIFNYF